MLILDEPLELVESFEERDGLEFESREDDGAEAVLPLPDRFWSDELSRGGRGRGGRFLKRMPSLQSIRRKLSIHGGASAGGIEVVGVCGGQEAETGGEPGKRTAVEGRFHRGEFVGRTRFYRERLKKRARTQEGADFLKRELAP